MSEVVDAHDVWMIKPSHRSGLADEPLLERGVFLKVCVQHLHGDRSVQAPMGRLVDGPHPTRTDQLEVLEPG